MTTSGSSAKLAGTAGGWRAPRGDRWRRPSSRRTRRPGSWAGAGRARDPRLEVGGDGRHELEVLVDRGRRRRRAAPSPRPSVPSSSVARWTCATEPEAKGSDSNEPNSSATGPPSCASTRRWATPGGSAGTSACSLLELVGDVLADEVGAQAQHLAELDARRAQLGQRVAEPCAVGGLELLRGHLAIDQVARRARCRRCRHLAPPTRRGRCAASTFAISLNRRRCDDERISQICQEALLVRHADEPRSSSCSRGPTTRVGWAR